MIAEGTLSYAQGCKFSNLSKGFCSLEKVDSWKPYKVITAESNDQCMIHHLITIGDFNSKKLFTFCFRIFFL